MDFSIGELAALTGLPVKTIRYYSDIGLVPEARRTDAGYRRYDSTGLARLELVRTLRDLGIDLAAIRRVAETRMTLQEVARAHADGIDLHIRQLTLRRAVLRALARNGSRPEEVRRMTAFARASADEAGRIMEAFLAAVFADHEDDPFAERMRAALPVLPAEPSEAEIDAWIELAALVDDASFRQRIREMVVEGQRRRAMPGAVEPDAAINAANQAVTARAGDAVTHGIPPGSPEGAAIVSELAGLFGAAAGREDDASYRAELADRLETFSDRRVERYWQLIGIINGRPAQASIVPAYEWLVAGLRG
ncbi:MAG TPA: MerR family transcriptional regulator [Candidatus Saccharimonadales bacterium]|nr:MerR family transcriptional regulator [Candidatus Saccharimonadales bacterium]